MPTSRRSRLDDPTAGNRSQRYRARRARRPFPSRSRKLQLEPLEFRRLLAAGTVEPWLDPLQTVPATAVLAATPAAAAESGYCELKPSGHTLCSDPAPEPPQDFPGDESPPEDGPAPAPYPLAETFRLHSYPGATKTIYLDFDGHVTSGTIWNSNHNGGNDIVTPPYSYEGGSGFSDAELGRIQAIWERVAEDFRPFAVDVTTEDPGVEALKKSGSGDTAWGIRVVIGGNSSDWYGGGGGVAYVGSFDWSTDTPAFCFADNLANGHERYTAECIAHETGHSLGLGHDGTSSEEYYQGHGSGVTGWAPIMGNGYYQLLTQWSRGEYPGADNSQDDLEIITSSNGFAYRPDDHANLPATATSLNPAASTILAAEGIIEQTTDVDYFSFTTGSGPVSIGVTPFYRGPNLDILATLYDEHGTEIAASNPSDTLDASLNVTLAAGTYYVSVDGTGREPLDSNYSDYGSLGYFQIAGTAAAADANESPVASDDVWSVRYETQLSVAAPGLLLNDADPDGDPLTAVKVTDPAHGTLSFNADGSFTYLPEAGFIGTDSFTYRVNDGTVDSDIATVTLQALPVVQVGDHRLAPGKANQTIPIYVSGGIPVQGMNFNVQVADGGPEADGSVLGPAIQHVEILANTIFEGNNTGAADDMDGSGMEDLIPQFETRDTTTDSGTVIAEGLIGTVTLDTSGFSEGSWPLVMSLTLNGPTDFAVVPALVLDGTLAIDQSPAISDITDQTTLEDTATPAIAFTVGDAETPAGSLTVTATSDNPTLVPQSNITIGGSDANRTIALTPAENQSGTATITVAVTDGINSSSDTFQLTVTPTADVVGRFAFYNHSLWDGNAEEANSADDAAVATDKQPLLPGQTATFANYTSFASGINGILIDLEDLPDAAELTAADFEFHSGNTADPTNWSEAPPPAAVQTRPGSGVDGSTRVSLVWDDATAVRNQWLQITVKPTANTGLGSSDVFYFGNSVGESGNSTSDTYVNATDEILARNNPRNFLNPATIDDPYDFNRDGRVNATDEILARNNSTSFLTSLQLISPSPPASGSQPESPGESPASPVPASSTAEGEAPAIKESSLVLNASCEARTGPAGPLRTLVPPDRLSTFRVISVQYQCSCRRQTAGFHALASVATTVISRTVLTASAPAGNELRPWSVAGFGGPSAIRLGPPALGPILVQSHLARALPIRKGSDALLGAEIAREPGGCSASDVDPLFSRHAGAEEETLGTAAGQGSHRAP